MNAEQWSYFSPRLSYVATLPCETTIYIALIAIYGKQPVTSYQELVYLLTNRIVQMSTS